MLATMRRDDAFVRAGGSQQAAPVLSAGAVD